MNLNQSEGACKDKGKLKKKVYDKVVRENLIWHNGKLIVEDEALSFCTEK